MEGRGSEEGRVREEGKGRKGNGEKEEWSKAERQKQNRKWGREGNGKGWNRNTVRQEGDRGKVERWNGD